jgi:hypothetical protein
MAPASYSNAQDAGLRPVLLFALSQWKFAAKITAAFMVFGLFTYLFFVPHSLTSTLLINDAQTSQLQAFTNNFFALSKTSASARKAQTPAAQAVDYLERQDTYSAFLKYLSVQVVAADTSKESSEGFSQLGSYLGVDLRKSDYNVRRTAAKIRRLIKISAASATEVSIAASSGNAEFTYFLNTEYSKFAIEALKQQAEKEMDQVRHAIERQRDHFKAQFEANNKELIAFQSRPENVLSLASGANVGTYISELVVRKNEIELKMADNERAIQYLGGEKSARLADARGLGQRSQVQQLVEENALLRKQASSIQDSIRKFSSATNGTAEAMRMYDELKKTTDREFKNFQEANDLLSKMGVYNVSIAGKFELLHMPEIEEVRKAASSYLVLALAFFLSQLIFTGYIYYMWTVTTQLRPGRAAKGVGLVNAAGLPKYPQEVPAVEFIK